MTTVAAWERAASYAEERAKEAFPKRARTETGIMEGATV